MAALPYIQFYVADYLADTMHLTTEEHGAYLLLIMNYWQTGHAIPNERLASVARMTNERWNFVENTLSEFFTEDEQGRWFHARIEQDLARVRRQSKQRSEAGKASAAKRAGTKPIDKSNKINGRSKPVKSSLNENTTNTDTYTDTDKDIKSLCPRKFSDVDMKAARWMFSLVQQVNPGHKPPNFDKWADEIRLIRERDKKTHGDIKNLFTWANNDPFWRANILSPSKLRKQWDTLTARMNNPITTKPRGHEIGDEIGRQWIEEENAKRGDDGSPLQDFQPALSGDVDEEL